VGLPSGAVVGLLVLDLARLLEEVADFLLARTFGLFSARAEGEPTMTVLTAGDETADASIDAIDVAGLEPAAATSAVIVETTLEAITCASSAGASTIDGWVAVTSGIGAVEFSESITEWDVERVSIDEAPETKDCEAPTCLGLTAYRTAATPTPVPKSMVSICSKTIFAVTPDDKTLHRIICCQVKRISQ
jgi:hypothetical protein